MRFVILTDIHANREAFEAVLADVVSREIKQVVILGDVVGYGPDPEWCVEKTAALAKAGAVCVLGNHDSVATGQVESLGTHSTQRRHTSLGPPRGEMLHFLNALDH